MPSKKKKYNARFPPGRIKKIMQTDEEVGKVAQAVPIIISRTLELFVHSLLTKTMMITNAKQAKTLSPSHMKQCILSERRFDFLRDHVKGIPDVSGGDDEIQTPPSTPVIQATSCNMPVTSTAKNLPEEVSIYHNFASSYAHVPSRRRSTEKVDKTSNKISQPIQSNQTHQQDASGTVPKYTITVPSTFNANQPNFYMEVKSESSENDPKTSSYDQPVFNFNCTANIDEDYDT